MALVVAAIGATAFVLQFERVQVNRGSQKRGWLILTAMSAGAAVWCTHFVAMLAYRTDAQAVLVPSITIASLLIAVVGSGLGLALVEQRAPNMLRRAAGGVIFGLSIAAMHFTGMAGYRFDGIVTWDPGYVAAAVVVSVVFAIGVVLALTQEGMPRQRVVGATLFTLAVALLHFTGMTALQIDALPLSDSALGPHDREALAAIAAIVGMLVIANGVAAAFIDKRARSETKLHFERLKVTDALTGLPNRNRLREIIRARIDQAELEGERFALVKIDLDRFSDVNDLHGHLVGDEVLKIAATRISAPLSHADSAARVDGDEFALLVSGGDYDRISRLLSYIRSSLAKPMPLDGAEVRVAASFGVAVYPRDGDDGPALSRNADLAMARAKSQGSRQACFYNPELDEEVRRRRELAADLKAALAADDGQLYLEYQPQSDISLSRVIAYEALLRWKHPVSGLVSPELFIAVAEEYGLIVQVGNWVLGTACHEAAGWDAGIKVAVNVSPLQFSQSELPRQVRMELDRTGLPAARLELELTENALLADRDQALRIIGSLKTLGVGLALDDFGTGYSSLETLRSFPFDKIKLDRCFIAEPDAPVEETAIVRAVLALGQAFSIPVLAEGVETEEQLAVLQQEGCRLVQGYLVGRPSARPDFTPSYLHAGAALT
ncbi:hypothetical protein B5C34_01800 [Pacificimonas flava]|uniref:Diguanylate cyclase/phosphodiesterase n=1 Tax=Pacificimonas flava TaxID=1234595 RepID=A0A219B1U9_9SPHN|nr:hypothetical protein B5C34_01800 [Pacificimonas flava]